MKTNKLFILLTAVCMFFVYSCEDDIQTQNNQELVLKGKGGNGNGNGNGNGGSNNSGITVTLQDLGTLGGNTSSANAIEFSSVNNDIWIVGVSNTENDEAHAFLWKESDQIMHDLGYLHVDYPHSEANDINPDGIIIGRSTSLEPMWHSSEAASWSADPVGGPISINPANSVNSSAKAINNLGDVAGSRVDTCGYEHLGYGPCTEDSPGGADLSIWSAFMWNEDGTYTDLGTLGFDSWALGINDSKFVVGYSEIITEDPFNIRAFMWQNDQIGMIPGLENMYSKAMDVNSSGQIIGYYNADPGCSLCEIRGFIYDQDNLGQWVFNQLPTFGEATHAEAISDSGYVAGQSFTKNTYNAFLWHKDIGIINIAALSGVKGSYATDVIEHPTDSNKIFVVGSFCTKTQNCIPHAALWTVTLP